MNKTVKLMGDSIWIAGSSSDYALERTNPDSKWLLHDAPSEVTVTSIEVQEDGMVDVEHTGPWQIYTDTGFEKAIGDMVGFAVSFTEQGMQRNGVASLEKEPA